MTSDGLISSWSSQEGKKEEGKPTNRFFSRNFASQKGMAQYV